MARGALCVIGILYFLTLGGCSFAPTGATVAAADYGSPMTESQMQSRADAHLVDVLKDPDSRKVKWGQSGQAWLWLGLANGGHKYGYGLEGFVNAKNSYGGYTGSKLYLFLFTDDGLICVQENKYGLYYGFVPEPSGCTPPVRESPIINTVPGMEIDLGAQLTPTISEEDLESNRKFGRNLAEGITRTGFGYGAASTAIALSAMGSVGSGEVKGDRMDGTKKGPGFLGPLKMTDGTGRTMTEFSIGIHPSDLDLPPGPDGYIDDILIPSIVPTLTHLARRAFLSRLSLGRGVFVGVGDASDSLGFLAGERFPTLNDHITVRRINLHEPRLPLRLLATNERRA